MTFGTKLKQARQQAGFSQEQLAEKLSVSRSAIAKWETDKGMPDIDNLKAIAGLLDVSIDYLLDEGEQLNFQTIKEAINLDDYEKHGKCRSKKDAVVLAKYPNATVVCPLLREKKLSKIENILEWTVMPAFGMFKVVDQINNTDNYYYVEMNDRPFLVRVSEEFIISSELTKKITEKKFVIGENKFRKVEYSILEMEKDDVREN